VSKRLGKWKRKQLKSWVIKIYCHFHFPKHDSLKYWRLKINVNSHMLIQYINQSESLSGLIIFRFFGRQMGSPKKVHVKTTWNFRLQGPVVRQRWISYPVNKSYPMDKSPIQWIAICRIKMRCTKHGYRSG
jgi:hypothetical protein